MHFYCRVLVLLNCSTAQAQKKGKYACDESQPERNVQRGQHLRFDFVDSARLTSEGEATPPT